MDIPEEQREQITNMLVGAMEEGEEQRRKEIARQEELRQRMASAVGRVARTKLRKEANQQRPFGNSPTTRKPESKKKRKSRRKAAKASRRANR